METEGSLQCSQELTTGHTIVIIKLSMCLTKHYTIKTYWGSGGTAPRSVIAQSV